jgi:hypothetical protein
VPGDEPVPARPSTGSTLIPMLMACAASSTYHGVGVGSSGCGRCTVIRVGGQLGHGSIRSPLSGRLDTARPSGVEMPTLPTSCLCITVTCANGRHMRRQRRLSEKIHRRATGPPKAVSRGARTRREACRGSAKAGSARAANDERARTIRPGLSLDELHRILGPLGEPRVARDALDQPALTSEVRRRMRCESHKRAGRKRRSSSRAKRSHARPRAVAVMLPRLRPSLVPRADRCEVRRNGFAPRRVQIFGADAALGAACPFAASMGSGRDTCPSPERPRERRKAAVSQALPYFGDRQFRVPEVLE